MLYLCTLKLFFKFMRQLKITKSITNRESASLDKYLQEIGRKELITVDEEVELAQRIRQGDQAALDKLVSALKATYAGAEMEEGLSMLDIIAENKEAILSIIGSEYVMNAIQECCDKVLYNKQRFSLELFEEPENRADFSAASFSSRPTRSAKRQFLSASWI